MSGSHPDYNEVDLDGMKFVLSQPLQPVAVDRFPGKVTTGDYSLDSNDLLSAWVISDLTGGHGVVELKEGVDDNRYRFGDIYTRFPGQFTVPFRVEEASIGSGAVFPLGEMYDYANSRYDYYAASGSDLFKNNVDTTSNLTGVPARQGVAFRGAGADTFFFIPLGSNGYSTYEPDGPTFTNNNGGGDPDFQAFCLWDDKLIGIDNSGQLHYATTAAATTTFTSYGVGGKLDRSIEPKSLQVYYNRAGESAVHVITDSGVWVFDASTPRLYQIPDFDSQHPNFGLSTTVWRGNLYVGAGMDILEYNGSVVRNIGLSRDDGLPYVYQGYVRELVATQNALYAFVRGEVDGGTYYSSVHEYSGIGWHCVWTGSQAYPVSHMGATRALSTYRLYWGYGGGVQLYRDLPVSFTNPRAAIAEGGFSFGFDNTSANFVHYLETGRFDSNMKGYRKIANAIECDVPTLPANWTVRVKYRVDSDTSWTQVGADLSTTGHHVLQFGTITADGIYPGVSWETIEFRLELESDIGGSTTTTTPVVDSLVFSFLKIMNPSWSWTCQVDLSATHNEQSPENMLAHLVTLKNSDEFFAMKHRDATYRVRLAQLGGAEELGQDHRGRYTLSILEIPQCLGLEHD